MEYASGDGIVGVKLIMTKQAGTVRQEVMEWLEKMFKTKRFGCFSVEITMHEGIPAAVDKSERVTFVIRDGLSEERA